MTFSFCGDAGYGAQRRLTSYTFAFPSLAIRFKILKASMSNLRRRLRQGYLQLCKQPGRFCLLHLQVQEVIFIAALNLLLTTLEKAITVFGSFVRTAYEMRINPLL